MPRSGATHTSKGSSSSSHAGPSYSSQQAAVHISSLQDTMKNSERMDREGEEEEEEEEEEESEGQTSAERVQAILDRLDREQEALTVEASDSKLKSLRTEWSGMESNFDIAFQVISQVAERFAESLAAEGMTEEDENLQDLDAGIRSMIDLKESVKNKRQALEEIRNEVNQGGSVTNAVGEYKDKVQRLEEEYERKTSKQKYAQSRHYKEYKEAVWAALRDDHMPPLVDLIPAEEGEGAEDDEDDEIVAYGNDKQKFKCPLSLQIMVDPVQSTVCQHAFEKSNILQYIGNETSKKCPSCHVKISKSKLIVDAAFTKACHKFARREQMRKESSKTQQQATMLD